MFSIDYWNFVLYYVDMHVARARWPSSNGKTYESIYLRESFRQDGKVKKRDIANLTHCDPAEIAAIELALKHKGDLAALASLEGVQLQEGASVGAVWTAAEIARRLGLDQALGTDFSGQLALWQVIARLLDQGSRLSAIRLAQVHAACDVLGIRRGFDENDLYENLSWLCQHQEQIELRLFAARRAQHMPELFLYDVTSSYLEGEDNALGAYGYNRDGKKGKKQIVIGLLLRRRGHAGLYGSVPRQYARPADFWSAGAQGKPALWLPAGDLCGRPRNDQKRPDRRGGQGRRSLHHRHHQAADRYAALWRRVADGVV